MEVDVEIGGQILVASYAVLTGDAELCVLMGGAVTERGEWVYADMAEEDPDFPYLVQALERGDSRPEQWALQDSILRVDPWVALPIETNEGYQDYSQTWLRKIMDRIITLLDRRKLTGEAFSWARLDLAPGTMTIPTDNRLVQHATIPFGVRHARTREIANVLAR